MNISIVDDMPGDRVQMVNHLKKYAKENHILIRISVYESGEEFLSRGNLTEIDMLFLDIFMDKLTGMEVAQKIRQIGAKCRIVFVTTTADFALESYEVRAFDYLVKPISYDKVLNLMKLLEEESIVSSRYIVVKVGREMEKILISEIIYIDYHNHYIQIHTEKGIISTYKKFVDIESELAKYKSFLTCYRCIMIHMDQVEKIDKLYFLMKNGEYVPINRSHAKDIKAQYLNYIFGEMEDGGIG